MKKILFCSKKVEIAVADRSDGNMRSFDKNSENIIIENQNKLVKELGLGGENVARVNTQYTREVFIDYSKISKEKVGDFSILKAENKIPVSDGLATNEPGIGLLLPLADCLGVVFYDEKKEVLGLLHAGRHNLEQFGPIKFVEFLKTEFGCEPKKLKVYFSPFAKEYQIFKFENKTMSEIVMSQLLEAGILPENITDELSDVCEDDNYPSNSSGDRTERFAIAAKIA